MPKEFTVLTRLTFVNVLEAEDEAEAKQRVKDTMQDEYCIDVQDDELEFEANTQEGKQNQETDRLYDMVMDLSNKAIKKDYELTPYQRVKLQTTINAIEKILEM